MAKVENSSRQRLEADEFNEKVFTMKNTFVPRQKRILHGGWTHRAIGSTEYFNAIVYYQSIFTRASLINSGTGDLQCSSEAHQELSN